MATSTFALVRKESTREKVYAALRAAILNGQLKTGQRLVEIPLAAQFGVSRAVLREALQQLAHEGLVEQNSYKGTHVVRLTPGQIDEIVTVRLALECEAVRLAHGRLTDKDRKDLRRMAQLMARERDAVVFARLDLELHQRIWHASGNQTMAKVLGQVATPLFAMSLLMRTSEQRRRSGPQLRRGDHTPLVEAICNGSTKEAVGAMRFHLTENWSGLKARLAQFLQEHEGAHAQ